MKSLLFTLVGLSLGATTAFGETFTNILRQVQLPNEERPEYVVWDVPVPEEGEQLSQLAIDPGGARFELWTILNNPFTEFLLDSKYVSTYTPVAEVVIVSEDPYKVIPRTRADRPFDVLIETNGLRSEADAPEASKSVRLRRHVQSYGIDGTGEGIDRSPETGQASLLQEVFLTDNQIHHFSFPVTAVPGEDRTKVRGEERFSVFTIADYQAPSSQIASMFVQVWPVANASISGMSDGESLRFSTPQLTFTYEDLYPDSRTYAQLYPGAPALGTEGKVIPGSAIVIYDSVPHDRTLVLDRWDTMIDQDGQWTLELLTATPFGIDRLAYVTFNINRSIEVQGSVTTSE
ncbi:MAG: hypothetical protein ACNA8L_12315 [Luteolibacter sp.]|jgi:hypothetical protein